MSITIPTPVGDDETLIDHGCYNYYHESQIGGTVFAEKTKVSEPWSRHRNAQGDIIVRAERDSREFGNKIFVQSLAHANQITQFDVVIKIFADDAIKQLSAHYQFSANYAQIKRVTLEGAVEETELELAEGYIVSPLMRIYNGDVIQRLLVQGESQVLVPWIRNPQDTEQLLTPLLSQRQARFQEHETINIDGRSIDAARYEYFGGEYQPGTLFWLDQKDVMQRYVWQQDEMNCWDTRLEQYLAAP
ncbi:hypothetical protein [Oceanicoccus sp. KOV_DT_Chl]|uniref:hypothetical protein n=1 Tax=Oceanicoccus sp. KOV_DT_Chl TaxID=1904639 RepID=UPI000C7CE739|nr:hypothetical protein [Oceanicoccus sp. KOV_DT_Chl]